MRGGAERRKEEEEEEEEGERVRKRSGTRLPCKSSQNRSHSLSLLRDSSTVCSVIIELTINKVYIYICFGMFLFSLVYSFVLV